MGDSIDTERPDECARDTGPARTMGSGGEVKRKGALRRDSVKKNVAAIHVSGKLTLLQRKLSNVLLLNAYDELLTRRSHAIDARTLAAMVGYNSNDIDTLKDALRSLVETTAEWDMLADDGRTEWGVSALLASARLRGGVCEYAYSPALAERLHDPKIYAMINLSIQRQFSSGHALALYENCYRFVRTGSTGWWDIDLFRSLMGVGDSVYYRVFKQLNAKIIKPAVTEVNAVSNISLTPEVRRSGRSVSEIRFLIRETTRGPIIEATDAEVDETAALGARLRALGVSDRLARQWIAEHGAQCVVEKLEYVVTQSRKGKVRGSAVGYLSAALRDDWTMRAPPAPRAQSSAARPSPSVQLAERIAALRRIHRAACFDAVEALASARNPTQRDADRRQFLATIDSGVEREDFRLRGWRSSVNARAIFDFWNALTREALPRIEDVAAEHGEDWAALLRESDVASSQ